MIPSDRHEDTTLFEDENPLLFDSVLGRLREAILEAAFYYWVQVTEYPEDTPAFHAETARRQHALLYAVAEYACRCDDLYGKAMREAGWPSA